MIIARVRDTYDERENLNGGVFYVTRIDKEPPKCTVSGGSTSWTSGSRTITGTCSDTGGSGCKGNISYKYNGTVGQNYSITNAGAAGAGNGGYVYDNAGNKTACAANQTVKIDKKGPSFSVSVKNDTTGAEYTSDTWSRNGLYRYMTASDDGSGVYEFQYSTDGQKTWHHESNYEKWWIGETNGADEYYRVKDNVGNYSNVVHKIYKIDWTAPSITVSNRIMGPSPAHSGHKCYINLYYEDWGSGLHYRDLTGNITFPRANLIGNNTTKGGLIDYLGLFSVSPVRYDVTVCDIANNCSSQSGTKY